MNTYILKDWDDFFKFEKIESTEIYFCGACNSPDREFMTHGKPYRPSPNDLITVDSIEYCAACGDDTVLTCHECDEEIECTAWVSDKAGYGLCDGCLKVAIDQEVA